MLIGERQKGGSRDKDCGAWRHADQDRMTSSPWSLEALHKDMGLRIPQSCKPSGDCFRIMQESRADAAELLSVVGLKSVTECRNLQESQRGKRKHLAALGQLESHRAAVWSSGSPQFCCTDQSDARKTRDLHR